MKQTNHTISRHGKANERQSADFFFKTGIRWLPMADLIEQRQKAYDEPIDVAGRATIRGVLEPSAQQVGGPHQ